MLNSLDFVHLLVVHEVVRERHRSLVCFHHVDLCRIFLYELEYIRIHFIVRGVTCYFFDANFGENHYIRRIYKYVYVCVCLYVRM